MKAMILAAGLGTRMQPLTDHCPKPLLKAANKCLIDYHLERLLNLGVKEVVVNSHWLADQLKDHLERHWSDRLKVHFFYEAILLETAGGIVNALSQLESTDDAPFLLINGDIFFEGDLSSWLASSMPDDKKAELLLCPNPNHHPSGDFSFSGDPSGAIISKENNSHTYSGVGRYRPSIFRAMPTGKRALGPILKELASLQQLSGHAFDDYWLDVGTPERLEELNRHLSQP